MVLQTGKLGVIDDTIHKMIHPYIPELADLWEEVWAEELALSVVDLSAEAWEVELVEGSVAEIKRQ